jgi:hypothetical protein
MWFFIAMEPTKEAAPLGAVFSLSQIIQRRHALSSDPVGSCRILSDPVGSCRLWQSCSLPHIGSIRFLCLPELHMPPLIPTPLLTNPLDACQLVHHGAASGVTGSCHELRLGPAGGVHRDVFQDSLPPAVASLRRRGEGGT